MGPGIRTSLAMVVADELEADWAHVRVTQAPGDEKRYGNQDTDGSQSMRHYFEPMRRVGAAARTMLETAAAARWQVPLHQVRARNHEIVDHALEPPAAVWCARQRGRAAQGPGSLQLQAEGSRGFSLHRQGQRALVDSRGYRAGARRLRHRYRARGHAVCGRSRARRSWAASWPTTMPARPRRSPGSCASCQCAARRCPLLLHPLGGVAVVATNTWAAMRGRDALQVQWDDGPNGSYDSGSTSACSRLLVPARQRQGSAQRRRCDSGARHPAPTASRPSITCHISRTPRWSRRRPRQGHGQ